jgi:hypothetical protein
MNFQERSYSGKFVRPRPECEFLPGEQLLVVATPWGPRSAAKDAVKTVSDFVITHFRDPDATSPFPRIPALSDVANVVRIGALMANDHLFRGENKEEYRAGVEFFAAMKKEREITWIQIGQPHVVLFRKNKTPLVLGANIDLSMEMADVGNGPHDPLPNDGLGLHAIPPLFLNSFRAQPGDKLALLSCSWPPEELYRASEEKRTLEGLTEILVKSGNGQPFWIGLWEI